MSAKPMKRSSLVLFLRQIEEMFMAQSCESAQTNGLHQMWFSDFHLRRHERTCREARELIEAMENKQG